jgi:endonuclease/exonuclease/phosphatase family metal-dependent hydrolase
MKKILYSILILTLFAGTAFAGPKIGKKAYVIGFYNLENLFDTYHDDGKNDYEFLPEGANKWTDAKYQKKLHNMATVIRAMADDNHCYHTVLGVSEIENRHVLEDLVSQPEISDADYQIVHYDGPDRRGVDVALLYDPKKFEFESSESIPFTFDSTEIAFSMTKEQQANFRTRDVLMVRGRINGEEFAIFVAHLPSRIGGKGGDLRDRGAEIIYNRAMKLEQEVPGIKIVAMGDMNDNPTDDSIAKYLHGKETMDEVGPQDFYSPFLSMLKAGYGSLAYRGEWNIYDIIVVNESLAKGKGMNIMKINDKGFYGRVFKQPFMTQQEGQYKGTPFRTFSNGTFINGYSDHYPTYIVVSK